MAERVAVLAQDVGCNLVIIESDCMQVVGIMSDEGFTAHSTTAIYDECNTMWLGFQEISIEHYRRKTNS